MTQAIQTMLLCLMLALGVVGQPSATATAFASSYSTDYGDGHWLRGGASGERYAGEQYDPDLGLYYLRARYYATSLGRFWSMDSWEGRKRDPQTLNKFSYGENNPTMNVDPSGNWSVVNVAAATTIASGIASSMVTVAGNASIASHVLKRGPLPDGVFVTIGGGASSHGATVGLTFMVLLDFRTRTVSTLTSLEAGLAPLSYFKKFRRKGGWIATAGLTFNSSGPESFSGLGFTATWPWAMRKRAIPKSIYGYFSILRDLARVNTTDTRFSRRDGVINIGRSPEGAAFASYGFHFNSFATTIGWTFNPVQEGVIPDGVGDVVDRIRAAMNGIIAISALN